MKIQSINNNYSFYKKNSQPNFKSFKREVTKATTSGILWRNNTSLYRNDMAWGELLKFLIEKYNNIDKVSVYIYACSIGLEAYTFLMELLSNESQKDINKFTPIIAKDFDKHVINIANCRQLDIEDVEINRINSHTNNNFDKFFEKRGDLYTPTDKLTELVEFGIGDFTKDYKNLPKDNIILCTRNCWPYFSQNDREELPRKLYEHLGNNATLITGNFDFLNLGYRKFRDSGFKQTYIPYVYEK